MGDEEFETVCSDCCVAMCDECKLDDDNLCGCYGTCDSCNCEVNRGSDGRKCMDCQEWLCNDCKMESECSRCGRNCSEEEEEEEEQEEEPEQEPEQEEEQEEEPEETKDNDKCI